MVKMFANTRIEFLFYAQKEKYVSPEYLPFTNKAWRTFFFDEEVIEVVEVWFTEQENLFLGTRDVAGLLW